MSTTPGNAEEQPQTADQNENNAPEQSQSAKKRREHFNKKELDALANGVNCHLDIVLFSENPPKRIWDNAWEEITKKVNEAGQKERTPQKCRDRWRYYNRELRDIVRKTEDHSQLQKILNETEMKLVKDMKLDQEIGKDVGHDSTDNLDREDDPDRESTSFNDSYQEAPSSPLVTSTQTPNSGVPVTSDDTIHSTTNDEQECTNSILTNIRDSISESVALQKEMLELLRNIMSTQKKANGGGVYEVIVKRQDVEQRVGENQLEDGNE